MKTEKNISSALEILKKLGFPRAQQNERSALCLLALLDLKPNQKWSQASAPLIGITPMMDFSREQYKKKYAPNSRETFRRQTVHQFVQAGLALYNPDNLKRPVNSPKAVYQIEPEALQLLQSYRTKNWGKKYAEYLSKNKGLAKKYAKERILNLVPVQISPGKEVQLSPGEHSELIKAIVEEFGPRFVPGGTLAYVGDTGTKWGYFDKALLERLGVLVNSHGKMPDVALYFPNREWFILIESVTSHGPVDSKRHEELSRLFAGCKAGLIYVTAFPTRSIMAKYLSEISWETEVWVAESPSHLIHFNGTRFLGPYTGKKEN